MISLYQAVGSDYRMAASPDRRLVAIVKEFREPTVQIATVLQKWLDAVDSRFAAVSGMYRVKVAGTLTSGTLLWISDFGAQLSLRCASSYHD